MSVTIKITGDLALRARLKKLSGKIQNPKATLSKVGDELVKYFDSNMNSEGVELEKKRWKALSPATIAARARLGYSGMPILQNTGKLKKGIEKISLTKNEVKIGNKVSYYPYHQGGTKRMPRRRIMGVNNTVVDKAMKIIKEDLKF